MDIIKAQVFWLCLTVLLTAVQAFPYLVERIITAGGLPAAAKNPQPNIDAHADWAIRAQRAHKNAVENLTMFAPIVVLTIISGTSNELTALACQLYFWGRLGHVITYTFGIPYLRPLVFLVSFSANLYLVISLLKSTLA